MARPAVYAGNWKMHKGPNETRRFLEAFLPIARVPENGTMLFFPPALSVPAAVEATAHRTDVRIGVQNVYWEEAGAFTGEISCAMAREAGAEVVLVGHSERRHIFGETVEHTVRKCNAALDAGLEVVLCVGETIEEREAGDAERVVRAQLAPVLESSVVRGMGSRISVAYEPVWAIGTGRTASPADAEAMHAAIRRLIVELSGGEVSAERPILYGGSVKPGNAAELMDQSNIDGVLVGGASLDPDDFAGICAAG